MARQFVLSTNSRVSFFRLIIFSYGTSRSQMQLYARGNVEHGAVSSCCESYETAAEEREQTPVSPLNSSRSLGRVCVGTLLSLFFFYDFFQPRCPFCPCSRTNSAATKTNPAFPIPCCQNFFYGLLQLLKFIYRLRDHCTA